MESNYWTRTRVSRRTAVRSAGMGFAGLAGAALLGCSDDDGENGGNGAATSSAVATVTQDTSGQPQPGGTLRIPNAGDVESFYMLDAAQLSGARQMGYSISRLLMPKAGEGGPADGSLEGDLAESWEIVDPTTYVFHLRQGVTWDDREPTNGRELNAEDVVRSFEQASETARARGSVAHAVNPDAPIQSMTATDDHTVEMKLAFPDVLVLYQIANHSPMGIYPVEAIDGAFDPAQEMRGTGPFRLTDYRQGVSMRFEKNPKWHLGPERPYLDAIELSIIPEAAQIESQFRAGNLHMGLEGVSNPVQVVQEVPGTMIHTLPPPGNGATLNFNWMPDSSFHDERVRRAVSMTLDRDTFIDVIYRPQDFAAAGINLASSWNNPLPSSYGRWWLDPKGAEFGDSAQYFQHNVQEARALLAAAGFGDANPLRYEIIFPGNRHDPARTRQAETWQVMSAEAGIEVILNSTDYNTGWLDIYSPSGGYWPRGAEQPEPMDGVLYRPSSPKTDAGQWFSDYFNPQGSNTLTGTEFPGLWDQVVALKAMTDDEERLEAVHNLQRNAADLMVTCPVDARTDYVDVNWAGVRGPGVWQPWPGGEGGYGFATEVLTHFWLDETLRS